LEELRLLAQKLPDGFVPPTLRKTPKGGAASIVLVRSVGQPASLSCVGVKSGPTRRGLPTQASYNALINHAYPLERRPELGRPTELAQISKFRIANSSHAPSRPGNNEPAVMPM